MGDLPILDLKPRRLWTCWKIGKSVYERFGGLKTSDETEYDYCCKRLVEFVDEKIGLNLISPSINTHHSKVIELTESFIGRKIDGEYLRLLLSSREEISNVDLKSHDLRNLFGPASQKDPIWDLLDFIMDGISESIETRHIFSPDFMKMDQSEEIMAWYAMNNRILFYKQDFERWLGVMAGGGRKTFEYRFELTSSSNVQMFVSFVFHEESTIVSIGNCDQRIFPFTPVLKF